MLAGPIVPLKDHNSLTTDYHDKTKSFQKKLNLKHDKRLNGKNCYVIRATWEKFSLNVGNVKFYTRDDECTSLILPVYFAVHRVQ
jgi:hypothetical protein